MKKITLIIVCLFLSFLGLSQTKLSVDSIKNQQKKLKKLADSSFVASFNGDYNRAIKTNLALLDLAEKSNDLYYLHRGYSILGYNYLIQEDINNAKESFEASEKYALLSNNETAIGRTYLDLANLYVENDDLLHHSFDNFDKSIQFFNKTKDSSGLASAHYHAIVASMKAKKYEKAYYHINKIQDYVENIDNDKFCVISVNSQTADYHTQKEQYLLADKFYFKVIEDSKEKEYWHELENTYLKYSESLFKQKRFEEAYVAQNEYLKYFKKNEKEKDSKENKAIIAKFELEKYKKDAAEAEKEKAYLNQIAKTNSENYKWLLGLTVALGLVFIYLLYILQRRKDLVLLLKEKNKKYLEAKKDAEYLTKSKSKFFSTVSHELRTPLYGVIGLTSILLEDEKLNHQKENLNSLKYSADYLMGLINDVLQINKSDSKEDQEHKATFSIRKLLERMVSSFEYKKSQNKNKVHLNIQEHTPDLIAGNDRVLSQILMNLIGNAHKFTKNGNIYVSVVPLNMTPNHLDIKFTVKDTGIGIAKDKQKQIFEEFSQVKDQDYSPLEQGSGLGLSIVKKLLANYNTEIEIESEPGKGSTFSFVLSFDLIDQKITRDFVAPLSFTDTTVLKDTSILIVDDNAINRVVTKKMLEKESVVCDLAKDGQEAVEKVRKGDYDLVLMDVNMPVKNGLVATREIREFNQKLPILALTAVEMEDMKDEIFQSGMNDIVLKPYNIIDFHKKLIEHIMLAEAENSIST